jgi:hypothetical protein
MAQGDYTQQGKSGDSLIWVAIFRASFPYQQTVTDQHRELYGAFAGGVRKKEATQIRMTPSARGRPPEIQSSLPVSSAPALTGD